MTKELEGLEEGLKVVIHVDLLRITLKISNWKTPGSVGIHGFWWKTITTIHDRLELEMSRFLQKAMGHKWMTKGKTTLIK